MTGPPAPRLVPADVDAAHKSRASVIDQLEAMMLRASSFTELELQSGVEGEWSTVESIRHLVFVIDAWLSRTLLGEEDPFHPIGLPPSFVPRKLPGSSIDPDARPTFGEACDVLRERLVRVHRYIEALTREELDRPIEGHAKTVAGGLGVIFDELTAHDHFINRDLDIIERCH